MNEEIKTFQVFRGYASHWRAVNEWSPNLIYGLLGDVAVQVMCARNSDPRYEHNQDNHKATMRFREFVDHVNNVESNDTYMVANNQFWQLHGERLERYIERPLPRPMFWMGPKGTVTPLHRDPVDVLHVQIYGSKVWRMVQPADESRLYVTNGVHSDVDLEKPDFKRYPLAEGVVVDQVVCHPGDAIYVPSGWFHHVRSLTPSISIGFAR